MDTKLSVTLSPESLKQLLDGFQEIHRLATEAARFDKDTTGMVAYRLERIECKVKELEDNILG